MPTPSFHEWLARRPDEAPAAENVATLIARSGTTGISRDDLARALRVPPETLEDLLRALVTAGQVAASKAGRERRYRAMM
jgi:DNA-binding IclR family transcriptional regulator